MSKRNIEILTGKLNEAVLEKVKTALREKGIPEGSLGMKRIAFKTSDMKPEEFCQVLEIML